jgi:hypothetical protein
MLIVLVTWCAVGALFGVFRAKHTYTLCIENGEDKWTSLFSATLSFLKWTLLGFITGISFAAWIAYRIMDNKKVSKQGKKEFGFMWDLAFIIVTYLALTHDDVRSRTVIE